MNAQKQKLEKILEETLDFYNEDPKSRRAINGVFGCVYLTDDGRMCAVGRMLNAKGLVIAKECKGDVKKLIEVFSKEDQRDPNQFFLKKYQGLPMNFLEDLRRLHDRSCYWNSVKKFDVVPGRKINRLGLEYKKIISDRIQNGTYDT